jgi:hemolysin activation/secretion protein
LVKEARLLNLTAGINNNGSKSTGHDRLTVAATHTNMLKLDHQLSAAYTTSLAHVSSVKQLGLSYRAPLYALGGVLGASYTRSDVVGSFGGFTSTGAGHTAGVNYTHYLVPQKGYRSYVTVGLDDKVFNPSQLNGTTIVGQLVRRSRQLAMSYAARHDADRSLLSYNLDLATNLTGGEGNNLQAYQSEDPRISTARWKALRGNVSYVSSLPGNWQWSVRSAVQYSPDALIAGEQFGLGGVASVRGTAERPIAGDRGLSTALEVITPELIAGLRLLGFVDAGWLANNNPNGSSKPGSDSVSSTGLGLRYGTQLATVGLDYGYVLKGSGVPQTLNSVAPKKGDQKLHVNLTAKF